MTEESSFDAIYSGNVPHAFKSVFGISSTYTRVATGEQFQVFVFFDEEKNDQIAGFETDVWKQGDEVEVLLADIGNIEPDRGDTFKIGSETLKVEKPKKNDGVFCVCEVRT